MLRKRAAFFDNAIAACVTLYLPEGKMNPVQRRAAAGKPRQKRLLNKKPITDNRSEHTVTLIEGGFSP